MRVSSTLIAPMRASSMSIALFTVFANLCGVIPCSLPAFITTRRTPENFFPAAIFFFFLPALIHFRRYPDFAQVYRYFGLLAVFLPVLVLSHWGSGSYLDLDPRLVEGVYQTAGFALGAGAVWLGGRQDWPETVNVGIVFFVIFLYTKIYDWCWAIMPKYLFFLVVGLVSVLILIVLRRLRSALDRRASGGPA